MAKSGQSFAKRPPVMMRYLLRTRPVPGQSRPDFLRSIAELNRMRGTLQLCELLDTDYRTLVTLPLPLLSAAFRGKFKLPPALRSRNINLTLRTLGLDSWSRLCPTCVRERAMAQCVYNRPLTVSCPKHGIMLIDRCPGCKRKISNEPSRKTACRHCRYDFATSSTIPVPLWVTRFSELFAPRGRLANSPAHLEVEFATARLLLHPLRQSKNLSRPWIRQEHLPVIEDIVENWPATYIESINLGLSSNQNDMVETHLLGNSRAAQHLADLTNRVCDSGNEAKPALALVLPSGRQSIPKMLKVADARAENLKRLGSFSTLELRFYDLLCTGFVFRPHGVMWRDSPLGVAEELLSLSDEIKAISVPGERPRFATRLSTLLRMAQRWPISDCPPLCEICEERPQKKAIAIAGVHEALGCWTTAFAKSILQGDTRCYHTGPSRGLVGGLSIGKSAARYFFAPLRNHNHVGK